MTAAFVYILTLALYEAMGVRVPGKVFVAWCLCVCVCAHVRMCRGVYAGRCVRMYFSVGWFLYVRACERTCALMYVCVPMYSDVCLSMSCQ